MEWNLVELQDGIKIIELSGRMDVQGSLKVDPAFVEIAENNRSLIVDLAKLDFLASLGIRTLVMTCKTLSNKNGRMILLSPQPNIEKVLRTSGIDTIIPIFHDRKAAEDAVAS